MFILSSIHSTLELWLVNHSVNHNSGLKVLKNIKFSGEISNNSPNDLFRTNVHKTLIFFMAVVDNITMEPYYFNNF